MHPHSIAPRRRPAALGTLVACGTLLLAACGGGGSDADDALSNQTAQGYAADAATMPVTAGTAVEASTVTLESALATQAAAAAGRQQALAAGSAADGSAAIQDVAPTTSVPCAAGGSVSWTASGLPLAQLLNGRLDAGESYDIRYNQCATAITGVVLDGAATLVVNAVGSHTRDLGFTATALTTTTSNGRFVLDGNLRQQLTTATTAAGGTAYSERLTSTRLALASTIGTRQASYELRALDWTAARSYDASGALVQRTHQGALDLAASTPRRPAATLQVATIGTLVIGSDGLAVSGGFSVANARDKWSVSYGATTVTITLDLGNDGTVDRTWTLTRLAFHGDAG